MKLNKCIIIFSTVVLIMLFLGNKAYAEEINLTTDIINAEITQEGSLDVSEELTFEMSGKYNGVFKDISFDKAEGISNITVSEVKGNLVPYKQVKSANNGDSGVFTLEKKSNTMRVKIYSPSKDERKTFKVSYKIAGAVKKYNDIGEFYWKFIGKENETSIKALTINVILPEGSRKEQMKAFGHGPLDGNWKIVDDRVVRFYAANLPSGRYVEVRTLFPKELLPAVKASINENKFENIMAEENRYINEKIEKAKDREKLVAGTKHIALLMAAMSLLISVYIFISRKKYPDIEELLAMKDIGNYNPAILAYNVKRSLAHNDLVATIFDLVRKGYLSSEVDDRGKYKIMRSKQKDEALQQHEVYLMHWLIDKIGDGQSVTLKQIKKYREKNPSEFNRQFSIWRGDVKLLADKSNLFDKRTEALQGFVIIVEVILVLVAIFFIVIGNMYGFVSIIASSLAFTSLCFLDARTLEGKLQLALWNRMKKRIKNLSEKETGLWISNPSAGEIYLVYAIAMGLRQDLVSKISPSEHVEDNLYNHTGLNYWMLYHMINDDYYQFNDSFSPPSQNTESSGSFSSSDSSGGFDSGGGGGAGGF